MIEAKKALKLNINDFSVKDLARADSLLSSAKLKRDVGKIASKKHNEIEMFDSCDGIKSLKDSKYEHGLIGIKVHSNVDEYFTSPEKAQDKKYINLNKNISDQEINMLFIDE